MCAHCKLKQQEPAGNTAVDLPFGLTVLFECMQRILYGNQNFWGRLANAHLGSFIASKWHGMVRILSSMVRILSSMVRILSNKWHGIIGTWGAYSSQWDAE